jgi:hypothetical protein
MTELLLVLAGVAFVPAGLGLMALMAGRAPRLALIGGTAVVVGALGLVAVDVSGFYLGELAVSGVPVDEQVSIVEGHESSAGIVALLIVGLLGFVAAPGKAGLAVAGALLFAGLAACGVRALRMSEQAWEHGEPAPERRTGPSTTAASELR